jgi:hypothetical protein
MKAALVSEDAPDGKRCLRIEGQTGRGWNYGSSPNFPLLPATEYSFSARMNVLSIDNPKLQPYVKIGLVDTKGQWFTNKVSSRYDTNKLGTWQELKGSFVTEAKTGGGHFAIEKGDTGPREATILLDDVRLEIVSAP